MSRQYSRRTFLRQVPNAILKEYFVKKELLGGINFDTLGETQIDAVSDAIEALPDDQRTAIESDFEQINDLAYARGVEDILEEAAFWDHNWSDSFAVMKNHYERAFWTFLNEPRIFHVAGHFDQMDRVGSWRPRRVGKGLTPRVEISDLDALSKSISKIYKKQGRGRYCHVDNYLRKNPERHCYFVYPEDHLTTEPSYGEDGKLQQVPRRPVFENIFVYRPGDGILELYAKGKNEHAEALQEVFCKTILGLNGLPEQGKIPPYNLDCLKDRSFPFPRDPEDGIRSVFVRRLRLNLFGTKRRITIEADASIQRPRAVYDLIDKALNKENVPLENVFVTQAKLTFVFAPRNSGRQKTLTFEIYEPNRCTLKEDQYDQVAKKYLQRWGIANE